MSISSTLSFYVVWVKALLERYAIIANGTLVCLHQLYVFQVRVVQHKQTRELYALKYINKVKCVKMKAVANVIQERRLLEEVCLLLNVHPQSPRCFHRLTILSSLTCDMLSKMMRIASSFWT
jgi:hypothetical protein